MKLNCSCNYCKMNTYLWELGNGLVWVEIPKNGSYNLKQFRLKYDSQYSVNEQPNSLIKRLETLDTSIHKRAFVILRNPIERFKSLVSHYFIKGGRAQFGKHWLANVGVHNWSNDDLVDIILENWNHIGRISEPHHFNSQNSFIPKEFFETSHMIYDMSELSLIFGLNIGVNSSGSSDIKLNDENLKKIIDIYEDDIELYQRYFNLDL